MWFWLSLSAAILWGVDYAFTGQALKKMSLPTLIAIELFFGFIVMAVLAAVRGDWKVDFAAIAGSRQLLVYVAVITVCFIAANFMITASIQEKGASLASIIEISYPFFVVIATMLIFKEGVLNAATVLGGLLVFAGVSVIYLFNK